MKKNKRYGGLILFLVIFLAFVPASALCAHAAESKDFRDMSGRADRMLSAGHDDPGAEDTSPKTSPKTSKKTSKKTSQKTTGKEIDLPQFIKDYHFDADTEKKRLAEAISKLDELGFSPEKLAQRFWSIISRKENREKIGKAAEELKENTGKLIEKASGAGTDSESGKEKTGKEKSGIDNAGKEKTGIDHTGKGDSGEGESSKETSPKNESQKDGSQKDESQKDESQKDGSGKGDSEDSQSGNNGDVQVRKSQDSPLYEKAAEAVGQVKEKVREGASKKVEEAIDQAAGAAEDYAVNEINKTAEKVKEEVR